MRPQFKAQTLVQTKHTRCASPGMYRSRGLLALSVLLILTLGSIPAWAQVTLSPGDILVVDANAFGGTGGVIKVNPSTGGQTPVACNLNVTTGCLIVGTPGFLSEPVGIVIESSGNIVVTDRISGVIRINPATGAQSLLASGTPLIDPFGLAVAPSGLLYITDTGCTTHNCTTSTGNAKVYSVNPLTGTVTLVSSGQLLGSPFGIEVESSGTLVVTDATSSSVPFNGAGGIIRVNPALPPTTNQTVVSIGHAGTDGCPFGVTVDPTTGEIYNSIFDSTVFPPYGCSPGAIYGANPVTGANSPVSPQSLIAWRAPFGMAVDSDSTVLIVDEAYKAVYRMNPSTGVTPGPISQNGFFVNPTDTAVVLPSKVTGKLLVTKTDGETTVTAGDNLTHTYTITVSNPNPVPALGVVVMDTWPSGFNRASLSCTPSSGLSTGNGDFSCSLGTLGASASATVTASYTVPSSTPAGPQTNTATATSTNTNSGTASKTTNVATRVNLTVTKDDGVTTVTAGNGVIYTYTITVQNNGPSDAANVTLNDIWPGGFIRTSLSCTPTSGTSTGNGNFACSLGTLTSGTVTKVYASYTVPRSTPAGQQTNTVSVTSSTSGGNTATASDTDTVNSPPPSADLSITKTGPSSVNTGASFAYTLTVGNAGPDTAMSVKVSDTLPAGVTFVSASGSGWTCSQSGGVVTCTEGSQAAGVTTTITINVAAPSQAGTITNTATASSNTADQNVSNNQSSATTTVVQPPPPAKWTGAGKMAVNNGYAEFGFNVRRRPDGTVRGQLEFENEVTKLDAHSISINTLTVTGQTATFTGTVYERVRGGPTMGPYNFTVTVQDNDQPPGPDTFRIQISDPSNTNESGNVVRGRIEQQTWDSRDDRDDRD